ncbi:hypothetical protein KDW_60660 [Dictyobacter vulcani]|uniref:Uncharacterized protein n=1 Tax=Dictyobacter vulcani TaxID=2607529 RepID=A0A5J4KRA5_9CHLR|nr:hypothetical protein KDW_60660 [Dictyobacter vulcani]
MITDKIRVLCYGFDNEELLVRGEMIRVLMSTMLLNGFDNEELLVRGEGAAVKAAGTWGLLAHT